jgi:hypothetical protein
MTQYYRQNKNILKGLQIQSRCKHPSGLLILLGLIHISKDANKCYLSMINLFAQSDVYKIVFSCGGKVCHFGQT